MMMEHVEAAKDTLKKIEAAYSKVKALCDGTARWTLSVPARPEEDPDLVIAAALRAAELFVRQAIEQAEQAEPVAWGFHIQFNNGKEATFKGLEHLAECEARLESGEDITLLYTTPPPRQPELQKRLDDALQSRDFYRRRVEALQQWQSKMRDPERTIVCDIIANGHTLEPAGDRYTAPPPRQPLPYNKEDMQGLDINQRLSFKLGWKSAEEAHGIKDQP